MGVFGERTHALRSTGAPLAVDADDLGLFRGLGRFMGDFSAFELSDGLPAGARVLASAGRDPGTTAFIAYTLGAGIVLRLGTPQWSEELRQSGPATEVQSVTTRIWRLLASRHRVG